MIMKFNPKKARRNADRAKPGLDRQHMFERNLPEVEKAARELDPETVIVIADSRDRVGRMWIRVCGHDEEAIRRHETACALGRVIPTFILAVSREAAIRMTREESPRVSEALATFGGEQGRAVLTIAAGGTRYAKLPLSVPVNQAETIEIRTNGSHHAA
jgi:hypothetical protein